MSIQFTDIEKQAIVSLMIEMINIDRIITLEEMCASNDINAELQITEDIFRAGMALDFDYACRVVGQMELPRKRYAVQMIVRVMDADGTNARELELLERIGQLTGLSRELGD